MSGTATGHIGVTFTLLSRSCSYFAIALRSRREIATVAKWMRAFECLQ